jgi:hypothetical protein
MQGEINTIMKNCKFLCPLVLFAVPFLCTAETWKDASLVDVNCSGKVKDNAGTHTRACALQCAKSGFGILTSDGTFLKFDGEGNEKAAAALKSSQANDHLRATVTGDREGDTIKVKTLKM